MKSRAAFHLTATGMFLKGKVYFWTITFCTLHSDWECSQQFSKFLNHLRKRLGGGWGGVRVAELHREHGVHFHMLLNVRIPVDIVREIGEHYGIGRIHACVADISSAKYMAKYLSKQRSGPKTKSGRNMRRWAAFGDIERVKVSNIINDSPMWVYRRQHNLPWLGYWKETILRKCWEHGEAAFKTAWFRLRREECVQDAFKLACGQYEAKGGGALVDTFSPSKVQQPVGLALELPLPGDDEPF